MRMAECAAAVGGACLLIGALCGCDRSDLADPAVSPPAPADVSSDTPSVEFSERLLEIAGEYKSYSPVHLNMNWAPVFCVAPVGRRSAAVMSTSDDKQTHGRKLYYLFAAQLMPYRDAPRKKNPIGQAVVKESWTAEEVSPKDFPDSKNVASPQNASFDATHNGRHFKAGQRRELFIMFKTDPKTPGTDNGWVYGTVSADGSKVTSAGRITSCMECHREAGDDRLFGPKYPSLSVESD